MDDIIKRPKEPHLYSRTEAYNFVKGDLFKIPRYKKTLVKVDKDLFELIFSRIPGPCSSNYKIRTSKTFIKKFCRRYKIAKLNKIHFNQKQAGNTQNAEKIKRGVMAIMSISLLKKAEIREEKILPILENLFLDLI
jgi:hypothetical protein